MTKKKFLSFTLILMVLLYIVSSAFLFFVNYKAKAKEFEEQIAVIRNELRDEENMNGNFLNNYYIMFNLVNGQESSDFNYVYAIIDSDGKLISRSSQFFCAVYNSVSFAGFFDSDSNTIYFEPYLTDETYKQILKYARSGSLSINSISIHEDGDTLIPVEAEFYNTENYEPDKALKIKFTDYEPDYTLTPDSEPTAECGAILRSRFYDKAYHSMYKNIDKFIADFHKNYNDQHSVISNTGIMDEWREGHHYKQELIVHNYNDSGQLEKAAVLYFECENNLIYDTLVSKEFYSLFLFMAGFFLVTGLVISIVGSKLIEKNETLNKSRNAFVSAAAHELKTPLAVIANNCECVLENVSPEKNTEYVTTVYDESKRMSKMVKSLLEYNKLSTDAKIKKETIDFGEIINREVSSFMPLIESKQIAFSKEMPEKVSLKCDEKLMSMVISNFLSNAVKFTPENGEIKITVAESGGKLTFLIFNSGSDISQEDAPHIWEELYTGSKSRNRDENSTGMGLAVSRIILEMHGFKYGFRNKDNGVLFTFYE